MRKRATRLSMKRVMGLGLSVGSVASNSRAEAVPHSSARVIVFVSRNEARRVDSSVDLIL